MKGYLKYLGTDKLLQESSVWCFRDFRCLTSCRNIEQTQEGHIDKLGGQDSAGSIQNRTGSHPKIDTTNYSRLVIDVI